MPIHHLPGGGMHIDGKEAVDLYRMAKLLHGLRLEMKGLRLTDKAPTCYSIIKREYGFRGNRQKVLEQFETYFAVMKNKVTIIQE